MVLNDTLAVSAVTVMVTDVQNHCICAENNPKQCRMLQVINLSKPGLLIQFGDGVTLRTLLIPLVLNDTLTVTGVTVSVAGVTIDVSMLMTILNVA